MRKPNERNENCRRRQAGFHSLFYSCALACKTEEAPFRVEVENIANWDRLLDAADSHGLSSILASRILEICPDAVPVDVLSNLKDFRRDAHAVDLILSRELVRLLRILKREGIAALPLKGPVLARSLYSDSSLRPSSDLDILVHPQDVKRVVRILESQGIALPPFLARVPFQKLLRLKSEVLLHDQKGPMIDLHWEIAPSDYPFRIDPAVLWDSVRPVEFDGIAVLSLSPEALLAFLCVHGAKHAWSRLIWLVDLVRLSQSVLNWEEAFDLATRIGCQRPLLLGLLLANEVLGAAVPRVYLDRACAQQIIVSLAEQVKLRLSSEFPTEPTGLQLTVFNTRLAERWWDKVRHFAALLKAPTEAELEWLSLPSKLFVLYYPLRFYRHLMKYTSRLLRRT